MRAVIGLSCDAIAVAACGVRGQGDAGQRASQPCVQYTDYGQRRGRGVAVGQRNDPCFKAAPNCASAGRVRHTVAWWAAST